MISHLTNRALTVHRPDAQPDGAGGQEVSLAELPEPVRVMVSQPKASELELAGKWGVELSHVAYALVNADVRRGDQLAGPLPSDIPPGRRLRVTAAVRESRARAYLKLFCVVHQPEGGKHG